MTKQEFLQYDYFISHNRRVIVKILERRTYFSKITRFKIKPQQIEIDEIDEM